jgi:hypothetical protein
MAGIIILKFNVQGSELPAFNAAEIARDIRVNLKLREKQRLTGTAFSAPPRLDSIPCPKRHPLQPQSLFSESLNRVAAEISSTKESLVLSREKVPPHPPPPRLLPHLILVLSGQRKNRPTKQTDLLLRAGDPSVARVCFPAYRSLFSPFFDWVSTLT